MNIALIPARSGSKRIPDKNIRDFHGHPLIAYTIHLAKNSGLYDGVYVSSDSEDYLEIAEKYGAGCIHRPVEIAQDTSLDWQWVKQAKTELKMQYDDIITLLRPTNPFRTFDTLKYGKMIFDYTPCDSVRGVSLVRQHPRKMWTASGLPFISPESSIHARPWECQSSDLEAVYVQNGAFECFWAGNIDGDSVTGNSVAMYLLDKGYEGFDINTEDDWILAEALVKRGLVKLPEVGCL